MASDAMAELRQTFFEECEEQLAELESGLLEMQAGRADKDLVNAVFRAVHSVKGGAGAFELTTLVRFAHIFETTLDGVRSDRVALSVDLVKSMLRGSDVLADLVMAARAGDDVPEARWQGLAQEIAAFVETPAAAAPPPPAPSQPTPTQAAVPEPEPAFIPEPLVIPGVNADTEDGAEDGGEDSGGFTPLALDLDLLDAGAGAAVETPALETAHRFEVMLRPRPELYQKGNDPVALIRELERLGTIEVSCDLSELPPLDALDPLGAALSWTIRVDTDRPVDAVRDVFEFCEEDCDLVIRALVDTVAPADSAPEAAREPEPEPAPVPEAAAIGGETEPAADPIAAATPEPAAAALSEHPAATAPGLPSGDQPGGAEAQGERQATPVHATIRVDLDRVDRLINLVGELVINQAMLSQAVFETDAAKAPKIASGLDELDQLTREIQESVMAIRAQPLKPLFQRMSRIVREVAAATGKQVRLVTEGEWTEVDKTVVEGLADPLTHMIRNAIDHGLEAPEKRRAAGKDLIGTVKLSAAHRSGRVVIEVADDGAGIPREKVRAIAVARGLIAADAVLTDSEMDNLLFMPGFSTVDKVSPISGRGVGMDVVKRSVHALSGRIFVKSRPGNGSSFTLSLPLTLAVLDGMVVSVEDQTLVAPLGAIVETMSLAGDRVQPFGAGGAVIRDRDGFVPLIDTAAELGFRPPRRAGGAGEQAVALLVESEGGGRSALMVDAIQDQRQVVIKSLETNYGRVPGVAAATILGDGRVALILDVDNLVARARSEVPPEAQIAAE